MEKKPLKTMSVIGLILSIILVLLGVRDLFFNGGRLSDAGSIILCVFIALYFALSVFAVIKKNFYIQKLVAILSWIVIVAFILIILLFTGGGIG